MSRLVRILPYYLGILVLLLPKPRTAQSALLREGFFEKILARGINAATAMEIAPDRRIFICEQTGALRVFKNGALLLRPLVTLTVDSSWERGLLGIALDPKFPENHFIYLNYIAPQPYPHHRLSRFTARGDVAVPHSEVILFEGDNQEKLGGGVKNGHQGGAVHIGKDGKLYVAIGDQTAGSPAQNMKTLQGKMLRLNRDGSIPPDNPFYKTAKGKYRAIWALGLRNPFTFAVQPGTGRIFINDVGGANEEINEGVSGANYGWPTADHGPTTDRRFRGPIYWYPESSITGGAFYNPKQRHFPRKYVGKYFFADFKAGWIKTLDPDHPRMVQAFATGLGQWGVVDIKVADDGVLYYLSRRAWVRDAQFTPHTGILCQVRYTGNRTPPAITGEPADVALPEGGNATFQVLASGTAPLRFQWQRNGAAISGATGPNFVLSKVGPGDAGSRFRCAVTNHFGTAVSNAARLTVRAVDWVAGGKDLGGLVVSPQPGTYTGPVVVRLTSRVPGVAIYYSVDGSEPTSQSPRYTRPFPLKHTATVKALLYRKDRRGQHPFVAGFTIQGGLAYGLPYREPVTFLKVPETPQNIPARLSQTGVFSNLALLTPKPGIIPYQVNSPLWSDGAQKARWIAPAGPVGFSADEEWSFSPGTVFIKHFELATDETNPAIKRRLETRLLVVDETGYGYGVTYKWRHDQSDADLLTDGQSEVISIKTARGIRKQTWNYPSRADCLTCHTHSAKFVLGVKARQLNGKFPYPSGATDNQLRTWNYLGLFRSRIDEKSINRLPRLVRMDDQTAGVELRARSYLDANCANCHRPGNPIRANFDARFVNFPSGQAFLDVPTVSDSLNIPNPRIIAPNELARSMLYQRLLRPDNYRMPPLANQVKDQKAIALLREWIQRMPAAPKGRTRGAGKSK
jgi:uncharacterized repeat protein (TIGR03806 family)